MALPKPRGLEPQYGAQFSDPSIVAAYKHRPPYPLELFDVLATLMVDEPHAALDAGCGRGELARYMLLFASRVDAVDISPGMIAAGKKLPGGDDPRLHWQVSSMEDADLHPPYALITTGASLHWMDWYVVMPLFAIALTPRGSLAIVNQHNAPAPWDEKQLQLIQQYSTNRDFEPYDLLKELEDRGLFERQGQQDVPPIPFAQSIDDYIEAVHSMNGFSRDRMTAEAAGSFDQQMRDLLTPYASEDRLELKVGARVVWGRPLGLSPGTHF